MSEEERGGPEPELNVLPENFDLTKTGWDSFAEYLLDVSGLIPRPAIPPLTGSPMRYQGTSYLRGKHAKAVIEEVVHLLEARHKPPDVIEAARQVIAGN